MIIWKYTTFGKQLVLAISVVVLSLWTIDLVLWYHVGAFVAVRPINLAISNSLFFILLGEAIYFLILVHSKIQRDKKHVLEKMSPKINTELKTGG